MTKKNILNKTLLGVLALIMMVSLLLFPSKTRNNVHADTFSGGDLTNTIWELKESLNFPNNNTPYNINFSTTIDDNGEYEVKNFTILSLVTETDYDADNDEYHTYWLFFNSNVIYLHTEESLDAPETEAWEYGSPSTITITGGTDATNANLISWLQSNAVYQGVYNPGGSQEQSVSSTGIVENTFLAITIISALLGVTIIVTKSHKSKAIKS